MSDTIIVNNKAILFVTFYGIREYIKDLSDIFESSGYVIEDFPYLSHAETHNHFEIIEMIENAVNNNKNNYEFILFFILPGFIYNEAEGHVSFVSKLNVDIPKVFYHIDNPTNVNVDLYKNTNGLDYYITPNYVMYHKIKNILNTNVHYLPKLHTIDYVENDYNNIDNIDHNNILILYDINYDNMRYTSKVINRIKEFNIEYEQYESLLSLKSLNEETDKYINNNKMYHDIYEGVFDFTNLEDISLIVLLNDDPDILLRLFILNVPIMLDYHYNLSHIITEHNCYIMRHDEINAIDGSNRDLHYIAKYFDKRKSLEQKCRNAINTVKDNTMNSVSNVNWCNRFETIIKTIEG